MDDLITEINFFLYRIESTTMSLTFRTRFGAWFLASKLVVMTILIVVALQRTQMATPQTLSAQFLADYFPSSILETQHDYLRESRAVITPLSSYRKTKIIYRMFSV